MISPWQLKERSKYVLGTWILAISVVLTGSAFAAITHPLHQRTFQGQSTPPADHKMGSTCIFTAGPRAGASQDFAPMQMPVSTPCNDGAGSTGFIAPAAAGRQMGTFCKFTAGPKAGATQDYAPMHAPVGTPCKDESGDTGVIIAAPPNTEAAANGPMGTVCQFTTGPKAGSALDSAPMQSPVGMPCTDGTGSSGVIVANAPKLEAVSTQVGSNAVNPPQMGSVCKFTSGPKAGTTHDYAPMHSPLNTACDDGAGSSGVIVAAPLIVTPASATGKGTSPPDVSAPPAAAPTRATAPGRTGSGPIATVPPVDTQASLGKVCKLTSGPLAGTSYDLAPLRGYNTRIGAPCKYGSDSTGVIVAGAPKPTPESGVQSAPATMGSVCSFTSGPLALTTADLSPKQAPLGSPCSNGYGSQGVIVEH